MREAKAHEDEDKRQKELAEARNTADNLVYVTEKTLRDLGEKVPTNDRGTIENLVEELKGVKDSGDLARIRSITEKLQQATNALAQQVYSWTDTNGTKHFSDTPPPPNTASAKKLIVHSGVTSTAVEAEAEQPKAGPSMAAAAGYSEDDIKRNCAAARRNLEIYNASAPGDDAS